jgi:hypothetical protein
MPGGFTIIELVISAGIIIGIVGTAVVVVGHARDALDRDGMGVEVTQRLRVGMDALVRDVRAAGAGARVGASGVLLPDALPVIELLRAATVGVPDDRRFSALRVTMAAGDAAQGVLGRRAIPGVPLQLAPTTNCVGLPACGFRLGASIVVYDGSSAFDVARVESIDPATSTIVVTPALSRDYAVGTLISEVDISTFELDAEPDGTQRLVRRTAAGALQPIVDQVVTFSVEAFGDASPPSASRSPRSPPTYGPAPPEIATDDPREAWAAGENCTIARGPDGSVQPRLASLGDDGGLIALSPTQLQDGPWCPGSTGAPYDADLFRVRRVDLRLRVEAAAARLRGPAGVMFTHGGQAHPTSWVPDLELRVSISPPNVGRR